MGFYKDVGERMERVERELNVVKASFYDVLFLDNFFSHIHFLKLLKTCEAVHLLIASN